MLKQFATRLSVYMTPTIAEYLSILVAEQKKTKHGASGSDYINSLIIEAYKKMLDDRSKG